MPPEGREAHAIWEQLDWMRPQGLTGPPAITFEQIESWCRLNGRKLTRFGIKLIVMIDLVYRSTASDAMTPAKKR